MSGSRLDRLRDRGKMFSSVRRFFEERNVLEVDCPLLSQRASLDENIQLVEARVCDGRSFLHSSPEYGMKRLLSEGIGDIYQLSHVFRDGERGKRHNPEFMMLEWYRIGYSLEQMYQETASLIQLFLGSLPVEVKSYRQILIECTGVDPAYISEEDLIAHLRRRGVPLYSSVIEEGKDALLNILLATEVEPKLGDHQLSIITQYPASQAALARKMEVDGVNVASRFEIYFEGVELANGYHELCDPEEQRERLEEVNRTRISRGEDPLPVDFLFLDALKQGLPDCCGVAVGVDRLMMLRHQESSIDAVIPWGFEHA